MKIRRFFCLFGLCVLTTMAYSDSWAQYERYQALNDTVQSRPRAVLLGNSITDFWITTHPDFFARNSFIDRGIGGQVSSQMLARFRADVLDLHPDMVIILAGTNDIAQNNGPIDLDYILDNVQSMCELAVYHHIRPVICSVLPASRFGWREELRPAEVIRQFNSLLRSYAQSQGFLFVDYYSAMVDADGGLLPAYSDDGVHPNAAGYTVMEQVLTTALSSRF